MRQKFLKSIIKLNFPVRCGQVLLCFQKHSLLQVANAFERICVVTGVLFLLIMFVKELLSNYPTFFKTW